MAANHELVRTRRGGVLHRKVHSRSLVTVARRKVQTLGSGHKVQLMKYMVIESFKSGMSDAVYARFQAKGRMLPDDLEYLDSWVSADRTKCFQLMQTDGPGLFANWTALWNDFIGRGPGPWAGVGPK